MDTASLRLKDFKRIASVVCLVLCLGPIAGFRFAGAPAETLSFRPELFFLGLTSGQGVLVTRGRADRPFRVTGAGKIDHDGTFVLDQKILFNDGKSDERSFRIRRLNDHDYTGTLTGVTGRVSAKVDGNSFHVRYLIRQPAVYMDQWIYLQPDGRSALNRSTVKVLGIPVAHLSELITRK